MTRRMSSENERRSCKATDLGVVDVEREQQGGTNGVREEDGFSFEHIVEVFVRWGGNTIGSYWSDLSRD